MNKSSGKWGQHIYQGGQDAGWNCTSSGAIVRFETEEEAKRHCDEVNKRYRDVLPGRVSRAELIPPGMTRQPSEIEAIMMLMREALRTGARREEAIRACDRLFASLKWGVR